MKAQREANQTPEAVELHREEWEEKVGRHIRARRDELDLSGRRAAVIAGISETTWRQAESGFRTPAAGAPMAVIPTKKVGTAMARALSWPDDALPRLWRGENPESLGSPSTPSALPAGVAATGIDLSGLTSDEVGRVKGYIDGLRSARR